MIIPCYLFTGLFVYKKADSGKIRTIAIITILFCGWMAYAGGLVDMLMTSVFYLLGIGFYIKAEREKYGSQAVLFTRAERNVMYFLCLAGILTIILLVSGINR